MASTSACCAPGKISVALSSVSPTVKPFPKPDLSPTTTTATSAPVAAATASSKPDVSSSFTTQPCAYLISVSAETTALMPSSTVTVGGKCSSQLSIMACCCGLGEAPLVCWSNICSRCEG